MWFYGKLYLFHKGIVPIFIGSSKTVFLVGFIATSKI